MGLSSLAFVHVYLVKETLSSKSIHEFIECQPQEGLCIISMESQRKLKLACHHNSTLSVHNVKLIQHTHFNHVQHTPHWNREEIIMLLFYLIFNEFIFWLHFSCST